MKKVLFTSTALVAFAGAAAAEVTISGWAEMGVAGGDGQTTQFYQDADISFKMFGETPDGLQFGTKIDLDEADNIDGSTFGNQGIEIYVKGDFGGVYLGDTGDGFTTHIDSIDSWGNWGSLADDETAHWGRQGDFLKGSEDGQVLRYTSPDFSGFSFSIGLEQDDASDFELDAADRDRRNYAWSLGAGYSGEMGGGTFTGGIGVQNADQGEIGFSLTNGQAAEVADFLEFELGVDPADAVDAGLFRYNSGDDKWELVVDLGDDVQNYGISAGYEINGFSFGGVYSTFDGNQLDSGSYWGIGGGYSMDEWAVHVNYGEHSFETEAGSTLDTTGWGVSAGYDLGGGLKVLFGYGASDADVVGDFDDDGDNDKLDLDGDTYSFGLKMSF